MAICFEGTGVSLAFGRAGGALPPKLVRGGFTGEGVVLPGFRGAPPARAPMNRRCLSERGVPRTSPSERIFLAFSLLRLLGFMPWFLAAGDARCRLRWRFAVGGQGARGRRCGLSLIHIS